MHGRIFTYISEGSKSSTHYLGDKNRFVVSSKGPSSGISVGGGGGGVIVIAYSLVTSNIVNLCSMHYVPKVVVIFY